MQPISPDWHESFFEGLWLEVQPHSFSAEQSKEDALAIQELLHLMPGARVLDVPCGDGRITTELAARGFQMTGLDRSTALLEKARESSAKRGLKIDWRQGDMWKLELSGRFDAAICLWHSFGYGTEEQDLDFFRSVSDRLQAGGALLLDGHVAETLLPSWEDRGWRDANGVLVAEERAYDPAQSRVLTEWTLAGKGITERLGSSIRIYTYQELVNCLRTVGFADFAAFGAFDGEPFELGSPRMVLRAQLPA